MRSIKNFKMEKSKYSLFVCLFFLARYQQQQKPTGEPTLSLNITLVVQSYMCVGMPSRFSRVRLFVTRGL